MPDDSLLTFFDLANAPQEEAAMRARARAAALQKERGLAFLAQGSTDPELRKMGEQGFGRAEKEREAVSQQMPEGILRLALEKTNQERQLAALQQQIEYQRGQLGLQGQQLGLESQRLNMEAFRPFLSQLLEGQGKLETINNVANLFHLTGSKLAEIAKLPAEARVKAIQDVFGMAQQAKGGAIPQAPGTKKKAAPPAAAKPSQTADSTLDALRQKYGAVAKTE